MRFENYITITPDICGGKPCIRGTRILCRRTQLSRGGMSEAQILADFPGLKPEHIRPCLAFAAARERRIASGIAN